MKTLWRLSRGSHVEVRAFECRIHLTRGGARNMRSASERIARFAFDYARARRRTHVTAVHKANVCKQSDGLFLQCAAKVAANYPEIHFDDKLVCAGGALCPSVSSAGMRDGVHRPTAC